MISRRGVIGFIASIPVAAKLSAFEATGPVLDPRITVTEAARLRGGPVLAAAIKDAETLLATKTAKGGSWFMFGNVNFDDPRVVIDIVDQSRESHLLTDQFAARVTDGDFTATRTHAVVKDDPHGVLSKKPGDLVTGRLRFSDESVPGKTLNRRERFELTLEDTFGPNWKSLMSNEVSVSAEASRPTMNITTMITKEEEDDDDRIADHAETPRLQGNTAV